MNSEQLLSLISEVSKVASSSEFRHHKWFKTYHLDIVHQIALELFSFYPTAHKTIVEALAWLHDYEKIIDHENQYNTELAATGSLLTRLDVTKDTKTLLLRYINLLNSKQNISTTPIEVQIVSSADGAAHMVGPFYHLYWYENPQESIEEIMTENKRKNTVDWQKKIVLPEARRAFEIRHKHLLEMNGYLPIKFLE